MCGFLGQVGAPLEALDLEQLRRASQRLSTRGNTGRGEWHDAQSALFHYRLAFRDLAGGLQPMADTANKRFLVFNGEIYRYQDIRRRTPYNYATNSDTEVLHALWAERGEDMLSELDGEYAFAIWEPKIKRLLLGRDAFGVKPLFFQLESAPLLNFRSYQDTYSFTAQGPISFASEMKGLPGKKRWEREGFQRQFVGLYEEIHTPFQNIYQVPPGALLLADLREGIWHCEIKRKVAKKRSQARVSSAKDFGERAMELKELIKSSVASRLDAEVQLGAYLSGGVDSRAIAQEMLATGYEFPSFTVGFSDSDYDESAAVRAFVASRPGIKAHLLRTTSEALDYAYSHAIYASEIIQPYTNGSAKWWLSKFARREVRGVLTGDGADELFCGYQSYRYLNWWDFFRRQPSSHRKSAYAKHLGVAAEKPWEAGLSTALDGSDLSLSELTWGWAHPLFGQIQFLANNLLGSESGSSWLRAQAPALRSYSSEQADGSALLHWQNYFMHTHFPTHVLNWVGDRMEMANTLEGRPPFLSRAILDFMRAQPDASFLRGFRDKAILRKALQGELKEFASAPKKQFNAPFLLDSPLAKKMLAISRAEQVGLISATAITSAIQGVRQQVNPLLRSWSQIFLQNVIVTHMLDEMLVQGHEPTRDLAWEDQFIDSHSECLTN